MADKKITEVTIRVSEELKNAMNDVAAFEDRKASDLWRQAAELYLYGHHHKYVRSCHGDTRQAMQDGAE